MFINKMSQRFRSYDLNEGETDKFQHFDESGNISNVDRILHDRRQEPDDDDVPHLHRPARQQPDHADRAPFVSALQSFRFQDSGCHGVVVVEGVLEEGDVAGQLDDGKERYEGCDVEDCVFTENVVRAFVRYQQLE